MTQPPPPPQPAPYPSRPVGSDLGRVAFIAAVVTAVVGVGQQIVSIFLPLILSQTGKTPMQIGATLAAFTFLLTALSLATLVLGVMGAQRGQSPVRSGIAIGVGALGVIGGVISLIVPLTYSLL